MKSLNEKRMLVKFAKMLGQPIDPALLESIEKEERLSKIMFGFVEPEVPSIIEKQIEVIEGLPVVEEVIVEPEPIVEAIIPPSPDVAQTGVDQIRAVDREDLIKQTVNAISNTKFTDKDDKEETLGSKLQNIELNSLKKQIANIMARLGTLAMGGGGTGIVRLGAADDFDSSTYGEGRVLKWIRGAFRLDEISSTSVVYNVTEVTTATYDIVDGDYYIGVTHTGGTTINLQAFTDSGRTVIIKDETGDAQNNNITIAGTIDNDAGGAILAINNGAVQLLYRNGWRII
jgi:hypothetical protein